MARRLAPREPREQREQREQREPGASEGPTFERATWDELPQRRGKKPGPESANPFLEVVAELVETMPRNAKNEPIGRSQGLRKTRISAEETILNRHLRWLWRAGEKHGVTVQQERKDNGDGTVTVWFWTSPKITRNGRSR